MNAIYKDGLLEISVRGSVSYHKELNSVSGPELNFMINSYPSMAGNIITNAFKENIKMTNTNIATMDSTLTSSNPIDYLTKSSNGATETLTLKENNNNTLKH